MGQTKGKQRKTLWLSPDAITNIYRLRIRAVQAGVPVTDSAVVEKALKELWEATTPLNKTKTI